MKLSVANPGEKQDESAVLDEKALKTRLTAKNAPKNFSLSAVN